jgi:hypothetical protein
VLINIARPGHFWKRIKDASRINLFVETSDIDAVAPTRDGLGVFLNRWKEPCEKGLRVSVRNFALGYNPRPCPKKNRKRIRLLDRISMTLPKVRADAEPSKEIFDFLSRVRQACGLPNVPVSPVGYWAKLQAGKTA